MTVVLPKTNNSMWTGDKNVTVIAHLAGYTAANHIRMISKRLRLLNNNNDNKKYGNNDGIYTAKRKGDDVFLIPEINQSGLC